MATRTTRDLATAAYLHMAGVPIRSVRRDARGFAVEYEDGDQAAALVAEWPNSACCRFDASMLVLKRKARLDRFDPAPRRALVCDLAEAAYLHMAGVRVVGHEVVHGLPRFMFPNDRATVEVLNRYVNDPCCRFAASLGTLKKWSGR